MNSFYAVQLCTMLDDHILSVHPDNVKGLLNAIAEGERVSNQDNPAMPEFMDKSDIMGVRIVRRDRTTERWDFILWIEQDRPATFSPDLMSEEVDRG